MDYQNKTCMSLPRIVLLEHTHKQEDEGYKAVFNKSTQWE